MINEYRRVSLSLLLMILMAASSFAVLAAPSASAGPGPLGESAPDTATVDSDWARVVESAANMAPNDRLSAALAEKIKSSQGMFKVHVAVVDRAPVNEYMASHGLPLVMGIELPGLPTMRLLELSSEDIVGLASNPGVMSIFEYEKPQYDADSAVTGDPEEKIDAAPPEVEDLDVDIVHGAADAWMAGFTGDGVKIAVIDTGFDMAHPDLQGQQARYTFGNYNGWPIAYDDAASWAWYNGEIGGWVANTTWTSSDFGGWVDFDGNSYSIMGLPVFSQSGIYHLGYHPDMHLEWLWGYPVAVLVVDANIPGVYDTVFVDILGDFNFADDKPCTMYDEISYYDGNDGMTWNYGWNTGDGFADLSGGMIYWISDGINVYPASDWIYGAGWTAGSGDAIAFMGEFSLGESHGTMTSSAALAAGVTAGGQLGGMAPDASLICIPFTGDIVASWLFAEWGADANPFTGDEANIVSNSYGWSDTAIEAGYSSYDEISNFISVAFGDSLWMWSSGNGGPGYGTAHSPTDYSSVHVGAGTTMQYRALLGMENNSAFSKYGDVVPFSNSGPAKNGKLNAEIIASGAYSLEPAPLNFYGYWGEIGDGALHFQIGSGTSHATPTVAGGAALGYQAFWEDNGWWPSIDYAKAKLMAAAEDMHFDPLKQGAGWLNAYNYVMLMGGWEEGVDTLAYLNEPVMMKAALYPGFVYGTAYESYPNFLLPGESDSTHILTTTNYDMFIDADVNITSQLLLRTGSDTMSILTADAGSVYLDITSYVPATTDLLKVTMWTSMAEFDPELDYVSNIAYWLELQDWVDENLDGVMNITGSEWELYRYTVDGGDCNYNQVMIKDPIDRTTDGLIVRLRSIMGSVGITLNVQLDYYELQTFPWISFRMLGDVNWLPSLDFTVFADDSRDWEVSVTVPSDAPVGTYAAAIYIDDGTRIQNLPVVINVAAPDWVFDFGGPSYFDTPYNNDIVGTADKGWRFEVGDWRIFYAMPSVSPPSGSSHLIVTVNWTELPTDVNVHVLAVNWASYGTFYDPFGPGWIMQRIAGSDEKYMGAGTFGSYTNTGGPKEAISAALGAWYGPTAAPIAIVTRCPIMAGNASHDTITGYTTWLTMNGYGPPNIFLDATQPGGVPLEGTVTSSAWYDITVDAPVEARGGGTGPYQSDNYPLEPVYQDVIGGDFYQSLADAQYTRYLWIQNINNLAVQTWENMNAPDIDLGLWYDANMNGIAELSEPYWTSGTGGSDEYVEVDMPADGLWIVKVLGYQVTGDPGYFTLDVRRAVEGYILATGLDSPVDSGYHEFNVSYEVPAVPGLYFGWATFGFMGADDMFSIYVQIWVWDAGAPEIQAVSPADGEALPSGTLEVTFYVNDWVWPVYTGPDWGTLWVRLDSNVDLLAWSDWWINDDNVTIQFPFALREGYHELMIQVADYSDNWATWWSWFEVNSVVDELSVQMLDPNTLIPITSGSSVSLTEVLVTGTTEPDADVVVVTASQTYPTTADGSGYFEVPNVTLVEGANAIFVEATNNAGVTSDVSMTVTRDTMCMLWVADVESPTSDAVLELSGWTDAGATVTIDGASATVEPDGTWNGTATLVEGPNSIMVEAVDALGNSKLVIVSAELDQTPPALAVTAPTDGSNTNEPSVVVSGTTEDGATVWVNGVVASDGTSDWSATVVLSEGWNTIVVTAEDAVGNSAIATLTVEYIPPVYVTPEELAAVQSDLMSLIGNVTAALTENVSALQGQIDGLGDALAENISALQSQLDAAVADIMALQASLAENITDLQGQIDVIVAELAALESSLAENVTALQSQIDVVVADIALLEDALAENVTALEAADDTLSAELQANVDMLEAAILENRTALNTLITALQGTVASLNTTLGQNVNAIQSDISDLQDQVDDLNQSLADDINQVDEKADDTDAFAGMLMYLTLALFIIAIVLIGVVWYIMNGKVGGGFSGSGHSMEEVEEAPSEVEREFEALEKEIKQDDL